MSPVVRRTSSRHVQAPLPTPTPRGDRRRAERSRIRRNSAMVGAPLLSAALAGGLILAFSGSPSSGSPSATPVTSVDNSAAALATWHHFTGKQDSGRTTQPAEDLGRVSGTYTLLGPDSVADGAKVVFVLSGAKRLVRVDSAAPYAVDVDTTKLPDGRYRLAVVVIGEGRPTAARYTLTIANKASAPSTSPTTTSAPVPTTSAPTSSAPTVKPGRPGKPSNTATSEPTATRPSSPATSAPSAPSSSAPSSSQVAQVLAQTNAQRAANGCGALTIESHLASAAQAHSADMAAKNYFAHNSQDGRSPFDRMTAAGYRFSTAGENIAMGYRTATDVMTGWMNSAGHRANILNCSFTQIGIGYAVSPSGSPYWTQDFGRPA